MLIYTNNTKITLFIWLIALLIIQNHSSRMAYAVPGGIPGVCDSIARITKLSDLGFGAMLVDYAGSLNIDTNDGATTVGGVNRFGGAIRSSRFAIRGCPNKAYTIILPDVATISSASASMNVDRFVSNPSVGLLDPNGNQELAVGARLNIATSQPPGDYSGSFPIEVVFE